MAERAAAESAAAAGAATTDRRWRGGWRTDAEELARLGPGSCDPFSIEDGPPTTNWRLGMQCSVEALRRVAQTLRPPGVAPLPALDICSFMGVPEPAALENAGLRPIALHLESFGGSSPAGSQIAFDPALEPRRPARYGATQAPTPSQAGARATQSRQA